jgi:hypothetical protein
VEPLPDSAPTAPVVPEGAISPGRLAAIVAALEALGITTPTDKLDAVKAAVGRDLKSARDLTADEGDTVLAWVEAQQQADPEPPASDEPALWPETPAIPA